MRNFDLSPLFRSAIGFDRLSDMLESNLRDDTSQGYPPYNIGKFGDDKYFITMALAGFNESDLNITIQKNLLTVAGRVSDAERDEDVNYIYKGIATRAFERKFSLVDYMKVTNANLANGLLTIELVREIPEEIKPKQITINKPQLTKNGK